MTDFQGADRALDDLVASPSEQRLIEQIEAHAQTESDITSELQKLAVPEAPSLVRYLANLLIADEQRHREMLVELANAIADNHESGSATPRRFTRNRGTREMLQTTRAILHREKTDRSEIEGLRRHTREFRNTTAWPLVLDLLKLDARKHLLILKFVRAELTHDVRRAAADRGMATSQASAG